MVMSPDRLHASNVALLDQWEEVITRSHARVVAIIGLGIDHRNHELQFLKIEHEISNEQLAALLRIIADNLDMNVGFVNKIARPGT